MARRKGTPVGQQARRDVMVANRPYLNQLRRSGKQARRITNQTSNKVQNIYEALGNELAPLSGQYQSAAQGISSGLQGDLSNLTGMLGSSVAGVPQSEIGAGTGMFGSIGAGALENLSSEQARNLAYNTSARRQGAIESAVTQRNYQTDLANFLKDNQNQRTDFMHGLGPQIQARRDELARQLFDQMMAQKDFGLRSTAAQQAYHLNQQQMNQQQQSNDAYSWYLQQLYGHPGGNAGGK